MGARDAWVWSFPGASTGCHTLSTPPLLSPLLAARNTPDQALAACLLLPLRVFLPALPAADANSIAQQALGNIRTVYAFNGAERTLAAYAASLDEPVKVCACCACQVAFPWGSVGGLVVGTWASSASLNCLSSCRAVLTDCCAACLPACFPCLPAAAACLPAAVACLPPLPTPAHAQVGIRQGFLGGLVVGITNCVAFFAYALALWYGSTRVEAGAYTGGRRAAGVGWGVWRWTGWLTGRVAGCHRPITARHGCHRPITAAAVVAALLPPRPTAAAAPPTHLPFLPFLPSPCRRRRCQRPLLRTHRRLCPGPGGPQPPVLCPGQGCGGAHLPDHAAPARDRPGRRRWVAGLQCSWVVPVVGCLGVSCVLAG